jgi:hypothetical protein
MSTLTVGIGLQYETIAAAVAASQDGDVVQVQAGTYTNDFATINADITLEGVGGMVQLVATEAPTDGKAIITTNADVTIRNFEFTGAAVADGNGAGIRYQAGDLVIENSYFHDNQEGLLANDSADGTITIRNSEFASNGTGDGYTHNLYVGHIATLTIEDSYFHDAVVGHEIKSRASETIITDSRVIDGDGTASYSIDLPNGGHATLTGNVIEQGANSENPAIIHFGGEGNDYGASSLTVTDNTVINDLDSSNARLLVNETGVTAEISDNTLYGLATDQIVTGLAEVADSIVTAVRPIIDLSQTWTSSTTTVGSASETATNTVAGGAVAAPAASGDTATSPADTSTDGGFTAGSTETAASPVGTGSATHWTFGSNGSWNFHFAEGDGHLPDYAEVQPASAENVQMNIADMELLKPGDVIADAVLHPVDTFSGDTGHGANHFDPWG